MTDSPRIALLDTNVLLLWLVGLTDVSLFDTFKRVDTFDAEDFTLMETLLGQYQGLISTPHVLAEVSNFVDQAPQHRREELSLQLRQFIESNREVYESAKDLVVEDTFASLGLADTGIWSLSLQAMIITTDFHLWRRIQHRGGHSINFNHLRSKQPDL